MSESSSDGGKNDDNRDESDSSTSQSKNQGGRPKKDPAHRRTKSHGVRLSPTEKKQLKQNAEAAGLSINEYIRSRTIGGASVMSEVDRKTRSDLRAIGRDLNQLAKKARESEIGGVEAELEYALADLRKALNKLA